MDLPAKMCNICYFKQPKHEKIIICPSKCRSNVSSHIYHKINFNRHANYVIRFCRTRLAYYGSAG
jgi:hypothetical protein